MRIVLDSGAYMPERGHSTDARTDLRTPKGLLVLRGRSVMREIMFRGKTDNVESTWVYGDLYHVADKEKAFCFIQEDNDTMYLVHKETVGQYTGTKDRVGAKIFEDDILQDLETDCLYEVKWHQEICRFVCIQAQKETAYVLDYSTAKHLAIVGNIYEKQLSETYMKNWHI